MVLNKLFCRSAGIILAITGIAKIYSSFGGSEVLHVRDPIVGINLGHLMVASGVIEVLIACVCILSKSFKTIAAIVGIFSINLSLYRIGLWWIGWHRPCPCLGNLTELLHISPDAADTAMKVVLGYLLIGSSSVLLWFWFCEQRKAVVASN